MFHRNGNVKALKRLKGLRTTFRKLWEGFERIAQCVVNLGGHVCIEWPARCTYWKDPEVRKCLHNIGFTSAYLDGCAYGTVNSTGVPLLKPWRVATNSPVIASHIARRCSGDHKHGPCRGKDCKRTELYTPQMASVIHDAIKKACVCSTCSPVAVCGVMARDSSESLGTPLVVRPPRLGSRYCSNRETTTDHGSAAAMSGAAAGNRGRHADVMRQGRFLNMAFQ